MSTRTLQAARFVTPVQAVPLLVAPFDCKNASPVPALELIFAAGSRCC